MVICGRGQFVREFVLRMWLATQVFLNSLTLNFKKYKHVFLFPYTENNCITALLYLLYIPTKLPLYNVNF